MGAVMFRIEASGPNGRLTFEEIAAKEAVLKAIDLVGHGMRDVVLTGPEGRRYTLGEFHLLLGEPEQIPCEPNGD